MRGVRPCRLLLAALTFGYATLAVAVNYPERAGFPFTIPGGGQLRGGHPAVADLGTTPGHKSIIFGTSNKRLYVLELSGTTWRVRPGFPVTLPGDPVGCPAIGDLGFGHPDIVIGYGSLLPDPGSSVNTGSGGVMAISRDGTTRVGGAVIWNRFSGDFNLDGRSDPVIGTPAIGDIDGDGLPEVVYGSLDAHVYALNARDGSLKPGWPVDVRDTIFSAPALHDIDGDGKLEVIIGVDAHLEGAPFNTPAGGCLHVLHFDGTEVLGFPQCVDQVIDSAPVVGDIDGDGKPEIVVGTGDFYPLRSHHVYAFKCDGTQAAGWPVTVDGQVKGSPALADLDGDGILDVVVTDFQSSPSFLAKVYAFKGTTGALLWKKIPLTFTGTQAQSGGDPIVADANANGLSGPQVLVAVNTEVVVFESKTGTQLTNSSGFPGTQLSFGTPTTISNVVATTIDSSTVMDVVVVSAAPFPAATNTEIHVFNPPRLGAVPTPPWGMVRGNVARTGVFPGTPSCSPPVATKFVTLPPCRLVDTRIPAGTPGLPWPGPSIDAARARAFPAVGQCGIPVGAKALSVNLTAVNQTADGNVLVYGGGSAPKALTVLYKAGQTRAACAIAQVIAGSVMIQNNQFAGTTDVLLDVNGYYQ